MSIESEQILNALNEFRREIKSDIKDMRDELRGDAREFERDVKQSLDEHSKRIGTLEQFRYSLHVLTATLASVLSFFGVKWSQGGG